MSLLTKAPRGTQDALPADTGKWRHIEKTALETAALRGFREIRIPTFEHTELFSRGVGDTTDVVQKEMYTFEDKGGRSITLRPEGTAGVVRSVIENSLLAGPLPLRVCYLVSCFRYEKPQAGRLREFHQFGAEMFGSASPAADVELISMAADLFRILGIDGLTLKLNSIGCPTCRKEYHAALKAYFSAHTEELCGTCMTRLEKNPMRILDCKSPICSEIAAKAPVITDYLCDECREHFEGVKGMLTDLGQPFVVDPTIVRGLDYYTKTVFEFVCDRIGAQGTVCGGGRYDGLVAQLGGPETPALGFAMGLERLLLTMDACNCPFPEDKKCDLYIAPLGAAAARKASTLAEELRREGFSVETDVMGRSLKAQMKYADKLGASMTLVLGEDELARNCANLKNMSTGETREVSLGADLVSAIYDVSISDVIGKISDSFEGADLKSLFGMEL
ncbi:MAG: histidine--tRNA ligase [Oscillospiraceae bacterium]|nr:histidine--tRNA ligase [Oscillospiraceae bacterium]